LNGVSDLVGESGRNTLRIGAINAWAEIDVLTEGDGIGATRFHKSLRRRVIVNANTIQLSVEASFEHMFRGCIERAAYALWYTTYGVLIRLANCGNIAWKEFCLKDQTSNRSLVHILLKVILLE
jgi:hypothetical protein